MILRFATAAALAGLVAGPGPRLALDLATPGSAAPYLATPSSTALNSTTLGSTALGSAALSFTGPATFSDVAPLHFRLERSAPEADSDIASPTEIRLWFSQSAQKGATSIRLLDADGALVVTGDLQSSDDHSVHAVAITEPLVPGSYTVAWRSMAADGHVVRGDFAFTVQGDGRGD